MQAPGRENISSELSLCCWMSITMFYRGIKSFYECSKYVNGDELENFTINYGTYLSYKASS